MDNQDGFDHALEKRTVQDFLDKLFSPWCKAFPKTPGCPTPVEAPPPATTPTPTPTPTPAPAPAPAATSLPAVVAPPPVETKTQPASPPVVTQPPVVVAPPATTAPAVVKPSPTSITPQPTKGAEQESGSNNPGTGSSEGSGQGNGSGSGPDSNDADKGNAGNAGNDGSGSGKGATGPVGSDNGNNDAVPPPSVTSDKAEVQPTATSGSHVGNGVLAGNVLLAAPMPVASHSSESGEHTVGDGGENDTSKDGDNLVQGSQPSATSYHSAIQHNDQTISTTLSTAWIAAGTPTSIPSGESSVPSQTPGSDDPSWVNPDLTPTPGSTHPQMGGGSTTGNSDSPTVDSPKTSNTGLVSGIAGGVVTMVVLFFILFALLYKYRRTAPVQNFLIKCTPLKVAAYTKRDKRRSSMGKGLLYEDNEPSSPTMTEKGKKIDYGTILPAPVTQPNPTACRSPTKATQPPALDTTHGARSPTSLTPDGSGHSMFERTSTGSGMSDYFPQPPSPTHSNHSRDARNSIDSLGGVSIASSGIFSASMMPPSTACSNNSSTSWASPPSTSHSQANPFQPLHPPRQSMLMSQRQSMQAPMAPREGQAGPSNWRDSRPDSWGF